MEKINKDPESRLYVSEEAIAKVIADAAEAVEGVAGITSDLADKLKKRFLKKDGGKIKISFDGDVLSVSAAITLEPQSAALETAERVQESIRSAVQNILGITVARVDVTVSDIISA